MTNQERNKICKTCSNHFVDDRYGIMCSISNNLPHFKDVCNDYLKLGSYKTTRSVLENKKKPKEKSKVSIFGFGLAIYILFKIIKAILNNV